MPASSKFEDYYSILEAYVRENQINCFYYYLPWIIAHAEDPEVQFDFDEDTGGIIVEDEGYKRFYHIPITDPYHPKVKEIIFDYPTRDLGEGWTKHDADINYIYNPRQIVQRRGNKYHQLRHSINACEDYLFKLNKSMSYNHPQDTRELYHFISPFCDKDELRVVRSLLESRVLFDDIEAKVLRVGEEIYSVNVWGRLCRDVIIYLVNKNKPGVPFLSDYSRLQFYEDIKHECEEVNDGSDLGVEGLKQFKRKYNPIRVDTIHTLVRN